MKMKQSTLFACLAALLASHAVVAIPITHIHPPSKAALGGNKPVAAARPLQTLTTIGLVSVGCDTSPSQDLVCPQGQVIQVQSVFFGRDVAPSASDPTTCPGSPAAFNGVCGLDVQETAALTAWVAGICDGKQTCAGSLVPGGETVRTVFGDPCPSVVKILRTTYACRNLADDPPAIPVQFPVGNVLSLRRPSTFASPKCPKYAAAYNAAANAGIPWQVKGQQGQPVTRLSLSFVDLKASDLDSAVRTATGGAYSLDTVAELNITALNFDLGTNTTTVIASQNTGFTKIFINVFNIFSNGSALDVRSKGPDANGKFGPEVVLRARNSFGDVRIMQNGLTAGHPLVSTTTQMGSVTQCGPPQDGSVYAVCANYDIPWDMSTSACAFWTNTYPNVGMDVIVRNALTCDPSRFQPLCTTTDTKCAYYENNGHCSNFQTQYVRNGYYGAVFMTQPPQADGLPYTAQLDRFSFPGFEDKIQGKPAVYGSSTAQLGSIFSRDGSTSASSSSYNGTGIGVLSTADFTISLDRHPSAAARSQFNTNLWNQDYWDEFNPPPQYLGLLELMYGPAVPPYTNAEVDFDTRAMKAFCPAMQQSPNVAWGGAGNISYSPATASQSTYGNVDSSVSRMIAGCADEMVSSGRFSDAEAFLADAVPLLAAPGSTSNDPFAARAFTVLSDLRTARKALAVHPVPFLSASMIEGAIQTELQAMIWQEANLTAMANQGTTEAAALLSLSAANVTIQATVDTAMTELKGDLNHVSMLQEAFDTINATYQSRMDDLDSKKQTFEAGVKKAEAAAIAEIVIEFLMDIAVAVATDGAGAAGLEQLVTDSQGVSNLAKVIGKLDKLIPLLTNLGTIFYNTQQLVVEIMGIVNQIQNLPTDPDITVDISAAIGSNSTLASLSSALLNFQDLKDEATIYMGPAITQGIDGAEDYALALQEIGNAGIDLVGLQVQLLSAQIKAIQSGVKLQAAQAAQASIAGLIAQALTSEAAIGPATSELSLNLLDRKMRALDLVYQVGAAFGFAQSSPYVQPKGLPDPSSPAVNFASAINNALAGLNNQNTFNQCFCNTSWIEQDPSFIGNLSTTGIGYLDLRDPTKPVLLNYFSTFDNIHMLQINLKPYGIKYNGTANPGFTPALVLDIAPTGEFLNTFTDGSGTRFIEQFLATPYSYSMQAEPTNGWTVTVPGSLSDGDASKYYVPTVYSRLRVSGDPNMAASWDWTGVWGVQVELWGVAEHAQPGQNTAGGLGQCTAQCSTFSKQALKFIS